MLSGKECGLSIGCQLDANTIGFNKQCFSLYELSYNCEYLVHSPPSKGKFEASASPSAVLQEGDKDLSRMTTTKEVCVCACVRA